MTVRLKECPIAGVHFECIHSRKANIFEYAIGQVKGEMFANIVTYGLEVGGVLTVVLMIKSYLGK